MQVDVVVGDVLLETSDVLISTANPWLNLSGGVNGAILSACGPAIQQQLHSYLSSLNAKAVPAGSIVHSEAGTLPFSHILHAVAIDPFYDSSIELVRTTMRRALVEALKLSATTIASPTLATGYGPLTIAEFGQAVSPLQDDNEFALIKLKIVVRKKEHQNDLVKTLSRQQ